MGKRDIVVIGASAGGLEPLQHLAAGLPEAFEAALFVVQHIGAGASALPTLLGAAGPLRARFPADGETIRPGRIYVAMPDHHMLLTSDGRIRLSRGPRENHTRPAIDPLFRSAAESYGARTIGVILSGALSDGTAGLSAIKRRGGIAIVEDPAAARFPGMPRSALRHVRVDHCVPAEEMPALLVRLTRPEELPGASESSAAAGTTAAAGGTMHSRHRTETMRESMAEYTMTKPVALICPECGGSMRESTVDSLPYFVCHIGHRLAAGSMAAAQFHELERAMEIALRTLGERAELCRHMAQRSRESGFSAAAERWDRTRVESERRAETVRRFLEQEWLRPETEGENGAAVASAGNGGGAES
ncbi:MAG TPA: chemotaxis protein CheB [Stellaceae bacterium]|jgi:two-component system chemotaxis response regulator CheB